MTREQHEEIARRYVEDVWTGGDVDVMDEIFTREQRYHDPTNDGTETLDEFEGFIRAYHDAFSDLAYDVDHYVAADGYVAFWGTVSGTHVGPFLGIEPTGNEISIMGIGVVRIEDGKIAERWANFDTFGMLSQLGVTSFDEIPHEW